MTKINENQSAKSAAPLFFLLLSILSQAAGFLVGLIAGSVYPAEINPITGAMLTIVLFSATACLVSKALALPSSWVIANGLVAPLLYLGAVTTVPAAIILALAAILALIYLPAFWTRVPYYPTSLPMYQVILEQLPSDRDFVFIDIGCGFGPLLEYLSKHRPNGRFEGIEIGVLPYLVSKLRFLVLARNNVTISFKSMWRLNLAKYDFVYCFLSPAPMERLWSKVIAEMQNGKIFMTNSFPVPAKAAKEIEVEDKHRCKLYIHKI